MSALLSHWLALREAADAAARSDALTLRVAGLLQTSCPLSVLDLGTGTGSNLRFLAERLPSPQEWLLVDRDAGLLSRIAPRTAAWAALTGNHVMPEPDAWCVRGPRLECRLRTREVNLCGLDDPGLFAGRRLVTASALLDLVSDGWLRTLAARCREADAVALFTITYDGRSTCIPVEPEDETVRALMNQHQKRDTGLGGPAAGPDATRYAERAFQGVGYLIDRARSDWVLGPGDHEFQIELIDGWASAAIEAAPDLAASVARWKERRLAHVRAGRSRIVVGHEDLAAWPPAA